MAADPLEHGWVRVRLTFEERDILADVLAVRVAVGEGVEAKLIDPRGFRHRSDILRRVARRLSSSPVEFGRLSEEEPIRVDYPAPTTPEGDSDAGGASEGP